MADVLILSEPITYNELIQPSASPRATAVDKPPVEGPSRKRPRHRAPAKRHESKATTYKKTIQVYRHRAGMAVLCFRDRDYCLTNGSRAHVREHNAHYAPILFEQLVQMDVTHLFFTDTARQITWELLTRNLDKRHPLSRVSVENLKRDFGECPKCRKNCVRWVAVCGLNCMRKVKADQIPHNR